MSEHDLTIRDRLEDILESKSYYHTLSLLFLWGEKMHCLLSQLSHTLVLPIR